jgi:hypothetical protein
MTSQRTRRFLPVLAAVAGLTFGAGALAHPGVSVGGGFHGVGHVAGGAHVGGGGVGHYYGGHYAGYRGGWYGGGYRGWHGGYYGGYYGGWGFFGAGLYLATLPWYYSTYYWDGIPYYYADNNYYRWNSVVGQYETVRPPAGGTQAPAAAPASSSTDLFMYPKAGQSTEQQAKDRYECHRWAADQTGFDPTQNGGGVAADAAAAKRADYLRADGACLEGRNYSVR